MKIETFTFWTCNVQTIFRLLYWTTIFAKISFWNHSFEGRNLFFLFSPDHIYKIMLPTLFCRSTFQTEFCKLLFRRFFCSYCCSGQLFLAPDSCSGRTLCNDEFINLALQIRSPGTFLYKLVAPAIFCIYVSSGHFGHFPCNTPFCQAFWPNKNQEHDLWNFCHKSFGHCDLIPKSHGRSLRLASSSR